MENTAEITVPQNYICEKCGAKECKLWREYQRAFVDLKCANCVEKETGGLFAVDGSGRDKLESMKWWIAAVPAENGSYWGYTSIPQNLVEWWHSLPTRAV